MNYPQPPITFRAAHPNNYTVGREGRRLRFITFHHAVGSLESVYQSWANPNRAGSSHFGVGQAGIHQYVAVENTAWTDGNWDSNLQSVTIEHEGDWRFGYYNEATIENSANLVAWIIANYDPSYRRHREVSLKPTVCPGDLPVETIWQRALNKLKAHEASQNPEWLRNRKDIADVKMYAKINGVRIWDLNNPSVAADNRTFALNNDFEISAETTVGGKKFYITKWSHDTNKANGLRAEELDTKPYTPPQPPADTRPEWQKNLVDIPNRKMWIMYDTFLIDLITGTPVRNEDGTEKRFALGTAIDDISAQTVIGGKSYYLTEYSFSKMIGRGFMVNALTTTDPTPKPEPPKPEPQVPISAIKKLWETIKKLVEDFIALWSTK